MKVLILRVGAMGDVLHALPAVADLRRTRPDWEIDWVVDERWAPLLVDGEGRGPVVSRVHIAKTKLWSRSPLSMDTVRSIFALRRALRGQRYDLAVDMQGTLRSAVIGWMAGARKFAGYGDPRERLAAGFYSQRMKRDGVHVVQQGAALLGEACGVALKPAEAMLPRDKAAEKWAEESVLWRPLLMVDPGGGWGAKRWPPERFGAVARKMRQRDLDCVVNASSVEDGLSQKVESASEGSARVAACSVAQLVALMRRTDVFVGGDSGPLHLAAALAVPLVALFGATDPARNGPWGPGARVVLRDASSVTSYKRSKEADPGIGRIGVDEVISAVEHLI